MLYLVVGWRGASPERTNPVQSKPDAQITKDLRSRALFELGNLLQPNLFVWEMSSRKQDNQAIAQFGKILRRALRKRGNPPLRNIQGNEGSDRATPSEDRFSPSLCKQEQGLCLHKPFPLGDANCCWEILTLDPG